MKKLQVSETDFNKGEDADEHHHHYTGDRMKKTKTTVSPFLSQASQGLFQTSISRREILKIVDNDLTLTHTWKRSCLTIIIGKVTAILSF